VNWISPDDPARADDSGEIDAVSPNPLPRKDFTTHAPAAHVTERIAAPPVGHVLRHPEPGTALRRPRGRK
jgi:hypothetical protein